MQEDQLNSRFGEERELTNLSVLKTDKAKSDKTVLSDNNTTTNVYLKVTIHMLFSVVLFRDYFDQSTLGF